MVIVEISNVKDHPKNPNIERTISYVEGVGY
jgi:hypothetical protein